jgi:hypothetical protein
MDLEESKNFVANNIRPIFNKLTDKEVWDITEAILIAYRNGYDQACLDIERKTAEILLQDKARNN